MAAAAPALRIRAQVGIELRVTHAGSALRVRGEIHDDLGAALPARELLVQLEPADGSGRWQKRVLRSDALGHFASQFIPTSTTARVHADFEGDSYYERTSALELVEPARDPLQLEFVRPGDLRVSLDPPAIEIDVRASAESGGAGVPITIENELARTIATGTTDALGRLHLQVRSESLGELGLGELVARAAGDATRTGARIAKALLRTRATRVALRGTYDRTHSQLSLFVRLSTQAGPIAQRAIGVFIDDMHLITLLTDARGEATRVVAGTHLALSPGEHRVSARYDSDAPGLESARSPVVKLMIPPAARLEAIWLLLPALGSLAFAFWSLRRSRRPVQLAASTSDGSPEVQLGRPIRGRTGLLLSIDGTVEDVETNMPLSATIELLADGGGTQRLQTTRDGGFASAALSTAMYQVHVRADGYAPVSFVLRVPHTGIGSGVRVTLRSLRSLALDAYAPLSQRVFRSEALQSMATVREALAAAVSGERAGPALERVTLHVERTAYGRDTPNDADMDVLHQSAAIALSELDDAAPIAVDPSLER